MAVNYQDLQHNRSVVPQDDKLSTQLAARGISAAQWHTLSQSLYPGAKNASVLLVVDYCRARNLDPMKKPCHIVPMEVQDAKTRRYEWRDVVLPGISEYRITAHRTGEYLGHTDPQYGPMTKFPGVEAPEWCSMTFYRWNGKLQRVVEFPVQVYFTEVVATNKEGAANRRWAKAPRQMLTKCTEAAGLREAFPEEFGGEMTVEEMGGEITAVIDVTDNGADNDAAFTPDDEPQQHSREPEEAQSDEKPRPQSEAQPSKPKQEQAAPADHKAPPKAQQEVRAEKAAPPQQQAEPDQGSGPPQLTFSQAFAAIEKAQTDEEFDLIRSQVKHLSERHRATIDNTIKNKRDRLALETGGPHEEAERSAPKKNPFDFE